VSSSFLSLIDWSATVSVAIRKQARTLALQSVRVSSSFLSLIDWSATVSVAIRKQARTLALQSDCTAQIGE